MKRFLRGKACFFVLFILFQTDVNAQFDINAAATNYTEDFNTLTNGTWSDNITLTGWYAKTDLTPSITVYDANTGTTTTGGLYAFGVAATNPLSERAFGFAGSNTFTGNSGLGKGYLGWRLRNNTGGVISSITVTWSGEQWRKEDNGEAHDLLLSYQTGTIVNDPNAGTWISAGSSFTSPITGATAAVALDGNAPGNRISNITIVITVTIPLGDEIMLRWEDLNNIGNDHQLAIDDVIINVAASSNTITAGTVSSPPYILANCSATALGTVDFTSIGTFNAGNTYTAQLSDDIGSFVSPVSIGTFTTIANSGQINITIPAGTVSGTGYRIRIVSSDPVVTGGSSASFTVIQNGIGGCASSHADYYRSVQTGNWASVSTWESSPDNINWIAATLTPDQLAQTISIRNADSVTASVALTIDQVVIENGGVLINQMAISNILTIANGTGSDLDIQTGGTYYILSTQGYVNYQAIDPGAVVNIRTGGKILVGDGSLFGGSGNHLFAATSGSYIWENNSAFEWNSTGSFASTGVIYFPDVDAITIPVFRTLVNIGNVGGGSDTRINGIFEANGDITFTAAGQKIFRNGIRGTGNITATGTSGIFIIDGTTAVLGGSGSLTVPTSGLTIGTPTTVVMSSDKTIMGNVSLLTDTYIELGNYDLTISGTISNATITSYVKTNGTGSLILLGVGFGPSAGKLFPVGLTTINPIFVSSISTADYSARIVEPITPPIYNNNYAVLRTWYISSSVTSPNAIISFGYTSPGDCGPFFVNIGPNVQIGLNISSVWNIHQSSLTPLPFPLVPSTYIITPTIPINAFIGGSEIPFALANDGAILPIDYFITATAQKINNSALVKWKLFETGNVHSFQVQRSINNVDYTSIATISPVANQLDYTYTDAALHAGTSLYRIKVNRITGPARYSNTVAVIHGGNDILITSFVPNPVINTGVITLSSAKAGGVYFEALDVAGRPIKKWHSNVQEGTNTINVDMSGLPAGVYHLLASTIETKTLLRFVKQ